MLSSATLLVICMTEFQPVRQLFHISSTYAPLEVWIKTRLYYLCKGQIYNCAVGLGFIGIPHKLAVKSRYHAIFIRCWIIKNKLFRFYAELDKGIDTTLVSFV